MKTVEGRFREPRLYLIYVLALLRPGVEVPVFHRPRRPNRNAATLPAADRAVVIDEARRQIDLQNGDMQRNQTRAATLLTITLAELVFLARSGAAAFDRSWLVQAPWLLSAVLAVLAAAGAVAVLTASAAYGRVDAVDLVDSPGPADEEAARLYAEAVGTGEATNAARLTVLRDGVLLAVVAAVALVAIVPFTAAGPSGDDDCAASTGRACPAVVTTAPPTPGTESPAPAPRPSASRSPTATTSAAKPSTSP